MLHNIDKELLGDKVLLAMDDGGRCLLDVIDDPQLLQSFLENTNGAIERMENGVNGAIGLIDNQQHKALAAVKANENKISSITTIVADSKQVDHVTSSGGTISPISSLHKTPPSGGFIIDDKQTLNMVSSSVGLIPLSAFTNAVTATSISYAPSSLTTLTNTTPGGQITSSVPLRAPAGTQWPQHSFQIATPRNGGALLQLPQQLIVPAHAMQMTQTGGPLSQFVLTSPRGGGTHATQLPPGIQPGQLVQIIQTPNGTQILPTNPTATVQQIVSTSCATKSSSTLSSSRSNKQILPKPPGSTVSTSNSVTSNTINKCVPQTSQQNTLKVINSLQHATNTAQFTTTSIPTSGTTPATQQILIGPNGQPAGVIGPQGTFLLNHLLPGIGSQPIFFQQNIGNVPNSVQLALRTQPHSSPVMTMNSGLTGANIGSQDSNSGLLSAFTTNQSNICKTHPPSQSPQPQTYVIPNASPVVSNAAQQMVMTTGGRNPSNFILTRPPSLIGTTHQTQPTMASGQQFLQIQTPNGPILVALQCQPQMTTQLNVGQHQTSPNVSTQPTHGIQLGNTMIPIGGAHMPSHLTHNLQTSAHPALHALLTHSDGGNGQTVVQSGVSSVPTSNTVIITSQPQIISRPQLQQQTQTTTSFVVSGGQQSKNSAPSVNLAELLKEHGILPESSPPSSPTNNSMTDITTGHSELIQHQPSQQTVLMLPGGANQATNIVLTQSPVTPTAPPQLRLALNSDGSVILHPHIATNANNLLQQQIQSQYISNSRTYNDSVKDTSGLGSSQPSPDSTTPSIDSTSTTLSSSVSVSQQTTTTTTSTAPTNGQNTSALLEQLNTGPAVKVPDLVASLALHHGSNANNGVTEESKSVAAQTPKASQKHSTQTALIPLTVQNINNTIEQQKQTILTIPVQNGESCVNNTSNAVIRIGNCDTIPTSIVLTTATTKGTTNSMITVVSPSNCTNNSNNTSVSGTTTTVIDQNGVPMIQVSPNNQEFLQRLETQLKSLLALKSPTNQQKELLHELLSLQQKMIQARVQTQNSSEDPKVLLTSGQQINVSAQTQQVLQQTQHQLQNQLQQQLQHQTHQSQPQNVHLVNLLKQTPVNQTPPQLRLLTPTNSAPVSATATIQVGNQLITFTTPAKQQIQNLKSIATNQTLLKPQITPPTPVILRLHTPTPTTSSTFVTTSTTTKTSIIKNDSHSERERRNIKILKAIQQQLNVDQSAALKPDIKRPFKSRDDACKRLLRYHVFNSPTMTVSDLEKSDELFETVSQHLLKRKQQLFDKFRILLLKQSIKETPSSEHVMLDRMFINEETNSLKTDKESVAEGKVLDLPPPPESWYQLLRSSLEEEQKLSINRKRKSSIGSEDEFSAHSSQLRRHEEPVDESEESEDDDEDSDYEENDEKDESISNYLQSTQDSSLGEVSNYYDNYEHNLHVSNRMESQSHVPLNNYVEESQDNDLEIYSDINEDNSQDWTASILNNSSANRRMSWNPRFVVPESEAAVAVESILNAEDEEEGDISVDLSGIDGLDDNMEDDNDDDEDDDEEGDEDEDDEEDDDDDDDDESVYIGSEGHGQHVDVQMQCAIKSILDMPSVQQQSHQQQSHQTHSNSYYHSHSHNAHHPHLNDFRNIEYPHIPNIHDQRRTDAILRNYSSHSTGVNDPILDEAVKSILS